MKILTRFFSSLTFVLIVHLSSAQSLYIDNKGSITFFSKTIMEDIDANNQSASSILNIQTSEVVALVMIKNFEFKNALMKEHFNENYMESEKFPKAAFKGKIMETIDFTVPGTYQVKASGKFSIHGVDKEETIIGTLTVTNTNIKFSGKTNVKLADYNISIPKIVFQKIAEVIEVHIDFNYLPKK
jgi:polyisoprenoid-binding protein YceI